LEGGPLIVLIALIIGGRRWSVLRANQTRSEGKSQNSQDGEKFKEVFFHEEWIQGRDRRYF
jgi:hypothetical protein